MFLIQTPGTIVFMIALWLTSPDLGITAYLPYTVTLVLQGILLGMCLAFKARQKKLGIDDWGNSIIVGEEEERLLSDE
jgi:hypothetical protein